MTKSLADRLLHRLEPTPDGCLVWTGWRDPGGYGQIRTGTEGEPRIKTHRAAWVIANGQIPDGKMILHHCDNPPCCNPDHLYVGDAFDNMRDKITRGRGGDTGNGRRRLDAKAIRANYIRQYEKIVHAHGGWHWRSNARELAAQHGTTTGMIGSIVRGEKRNSKHEK